MHVPTHFKLAFSKSMIEEALIDISVKLNRELQTLSDVVALPIMKGSIYFFADLSRLLHISLELRPVKYRSYDIKANEKMLASEMHLYDFDCSGKSVIIFDDICDSGETLHALKERLMREGAARVITCALIYRSSNSVFVPDFFCFEYTGPEWFAGYGMDEFDKFRNLPDIYAIDVNR